MNLKFIQVRSETQIVLDGVRQGLLSLLLPHHLALDEVRIGFEDFLLVCTGVFQHVKRLEHFNTLQIKVSDELRRGTENILSSQLNSKTQKFERKGVIALNIIEFTE